jgi:hypothetical protein
LLIQAEVTCRMQEGVPLYKNGMAKKKPRLKNLDPGKL